MYAPSPNDLFTLSMKLTLQAVYLNINGPYCILSASSSLVSLLSSLFSLLSSTHHPPSQHSIHLKSYRNTFRNPSSQTRYRINRKRYSIKVINNHASPSLVSTKLTLHQARNGSSLSAKTARSNITVTAYRGAGPVIMEIMEGTERGVIEYLEYRT